MPRFASILRLARPLLAQCAPTGFRAEQRDGSCVLTRPSPRRYLPRSIALSLALSCGLWSSGCELTKSDGYLIVLGAHHGEARSDGFPEFTGRNGVREFETDRGWDISLDEAIIMTKRVQLMRCPSAAQESQEDDDDSSEEEGSEEEGSEEEGSEEKGSQDSGEEESYASSPKSVASDDDLPENGEWIDIPLFGGAPEQTSDHNDGSGRIFAQNTSIQPASYCWARITFGPFEEPDEDDDDAPETMSGKEVPDDIHDRTAFLMGHARKGKGAAVKFKVAIDDKIKTIIDIRESAGKPLVIPASRQPVNLTISKVYDRFFDGVDFSAKDYASQLRSALRSCLKNETYVSVGSRAKANLAKSDED